MTMIGDTEAFKHRDAASYNPVVGFVDDFTACYSTPLVKRVVDLAQVEGTHRVLDIGTGTGVVALEAARRLEPPGHVVGIDLSEGMLARAREKADAAGFSQRIEYRTMDAEALAFDDGSFDAVVSLFALLHFPHPDRALAEMHRVLRPGGRMVVAVGSGPSRLSLQGLVDGVDRARALLQQRRGLLLEAPHFLNRLVEKHLPEGSESEESALARAHRNRAGVVPRLVREAGFSPVNRFWQGHHMQMDTPEAFWELQASLSSFSRKRLAEAPPEKLAVVRDEFFSRCNAVLKRGGRLIYPYAALFVAAMRSPT